MSDLLRMTGMYSGMDTEAVIQQLVQAKATKVTNLKNDQKKLEWKTSLWQDLNKRIYKLYTGTLSNMRLAGSYAKKKTTVSDPTKATITAGEGAVNGVQSLTVNRLAKSGYLTGAALSKKVAKVTEDTTLEELGVTGGKVEVQVGGTTQQIEITNSKQTLKDFISDFNSQFSKADGTGLTMKFEDGRVTLDGPTDGTTTFSLKSVTGGAETKRTIINALGLADVCLPDTDPTKNPTGSVTGTKVRLLGEDYKDETNTTLEELDIKGGKLTVNAGGQSFDINVDKSWTVDKFIREFNKENDAKGTGLKMSVEDGVMSVENTTGGEYTLSSTNAGYDGKTLLQGFGLGVYGGDAQTGKIIGTTISKLKPATVSKDIKADSLLSDIDSSLVGQYITLTVGKGVDAKQTQFRVTSEMKVSEFLDKLREGGVNATFDEGNQRFFISSTGTGEAKEFKLEATNGALETLGLDPEAEYENGSTATRIYAQDAEITLNGATFTSDTNTVTVNGLSITATAETTEPISLTTDTDYDGIYNMIKDFITEYNDIMNEMTKLYTADSARKYTMLSDDEKEAMTDDEVEQWEDTIKGALLRRDKDLNTVMDCMKNAINKGYDIGGQTLYLVNFGVGTGSYFDTEKAERNALHIFGDSDDEKYADDDNDLKAAIAANPDQVIELFTAMSKEMYNSLQKTMASTDYRSIYKVYDDKRMKTEYDDYTKKIKEAQKKLDAYEDKWYNKFSAMEVALSKLQSNQNSLASMLGQ